MFGDIGKIMKMASEMKKRVPEMQAKLAQAEHSCEAGGGVVKATVNGALLLTDLRIDPQLLADEQMDASMLEDLIKAAVAAAQSKAQQASAEAMKELTGGMELPPGLF